MYVIPSISPSSLASVEACPRFRPDGKENEAAVDGTLMHAYAEAMSKMRPDEMTVYLASLDCSPDMRMLLSKVQEFLLSSIDFSLPVYPDYRLKKRGGKPRKHLKPGRYPEVEVERRGGRHGYIDLMVVNPDGVVQIIDWKTNRVGKDFSLQLAAYAISVQDICPFLDKFDVRIVAPRLDEDEVFSAQLTGEDLLAWRARISSIEERADASANDLRIPGTPGDQCQYCHWNGRCQYQAEQVRGVLAVTNGISSLVGTGSPWAGEAITASTFTHPDTVAQRGLRRACLKTLETLVEAVKEDDKTWVEQFNDEQLKTLVPGFRISRRRGRSSIDPEQEMVATESVMNRFGLTMEEMFDISSVDRKKLVAHLVAAKGYGAKEAEASVKEAYEPYMKTGAPVIMWSRAK